MSELLNSRKERIQKLKETIEQNRNKPLKQIIAAFCCEVGIRPQVARGYYRLLIQSKQIKPMKKEKKNK